MNTAGARDDRPTRSWFPTLRRMPTRWDDNDHYGHVNNVTYYAFFDTAVNGFLIEATGVDIRDLPAIGLVVETSCRFYRTVSFPDELWVGLAVERLGDRSITYRLGIMKGTEEDAVAIGRFVHVYVDRQTNRSTQVPQVIRDAVERVRVEV